MCNLNSDNLMWGETSGGGNDAQAREKKVTTIVAIEEVIKTQEGQRKALKKWIYQEKIEMINLSTKTITWTGKR